MNLDELSVLDITPTIGKNLDVWPGDVPFEHRETFLRPNKDSYLLLSSIQTTLHLGAHTDAPNHYSPQGQDIASRKLNYYLGECQVLQVQLSRGKRIKPKHLESEITAKRVLFKTNSFPNPENFNEDFNALSDELVNFLAKKNVILVGLDTPSVDLFADESLPSHRAVHRHNMAILEGVVLHNVTPGLYQLIALPLPIQGGDASPVRAVLLKEHKTH